MRELIATEIDLGFKFLQSAAHVSSREHTEQALSLAKTAYVVATRLVRNMPVDEGVDLRARLASLGNALEQFQFRMSELADSAAARSSTTSRGLRGNMKSIWRPQGDSNPCYRRERAVS